VLQIAGLVLLLSVGGLTISRAYVVIGIACGAATLSWYRSNHSTCKFNLNLVMSHFIENWVQGKWLLASGLLWSISMTLYPWMLAIFHSAASTATWAACIGIISMVNPVLMSLQNMIGPKLSQIYAELGTAELNRYVFKTNMVSLMAIAPFSIFLIIFGDSIVCAVYGHNYFGNQGVMITMSLNLLISSVAFTYSRALFVLNRASTDFYINLVAIAVLAIIGIWLVKALGPLGIAVSMLISNLLTAVLRYSLYAKMMTTELADNT
jgi:O-antigen/teichoic acid export membrane protein